MLPTPSNDGEGGRPRVLVVGSTVEHAEAGLAAGLGSACDIVRVDSVEQALRALAKGRFAGVLSDAGDFGDLGELSDSKPGAAVPPEDRPAETGSTTQLGAALLAEQAGQILNMVGEGVVIVDSDGRSRWMNRRMRQWSPAVHEHVRRACGEGYRFFNVQSPPSEEKPWGPTSRRFQLTVEEQHFLEVIASPVRDDAGRVRLIVAVVFDATGTRRLQQKIDAIDKAGAELVKIESAAVDDMTMAQRLKLLEQKVISVTRDLMHFDHFNVRLIDPRSGRLELVVANGLPVEALDVELFAEGEAKSEHGGGSGVGGGGGGLGNGISGHVARTGRSYICPDVARDPRYVVGLDDARSSLTVPLTLDDQVVGVFNIESRHTAAFNEDDRQFAEIFGRYVAIALSILKVMVSERAATNKKVADDVASEIAGPLNDIALDVQSLSDDLTLEPEAAAKLRKILDNVGVIRGSMRQAARGPQTVLGARDVAADPPPDDLLDGARVLVVDDESVIRETIADVLRKYRVDVVVETLGQGAMDRLTLDPTAEPFDLILSDISMPDRSGYDVFAAARTLAVPPPVILMTGFGYDPNHCIVRASQEGLQAVLFKPFRVEQLLSEVRRAVEQKQR